MRAKMSQIESNRQAADVLFRMRGYAADPDYLTIYPDLAVAEVRAILAETEAESPDYTSHNQSLFSQSARTALIESLAAFVEA